MPNFSLFLASLREQQKRPGTLDGPVQPQVTRGGRTTVVVRWLLRGGNRDEAPDEQAFVAGVIHRLVESQNLVAWAREALVEDIEYQRFTTYGYVGNRRVFVSATIVGLGFWLWK